MLIVISFLLAVLCVLLYKTMKLLRSIKWKMSDLLDQMEK